jgi:SET domain-containing protein
MFRLDEDRVIDATLSGGLARYINHSCNPNCVTEIVEVDREFRIIIFAKRRIQRGEEVTNQPTSNLPDLKTCLFPFSFLTITSLTSRTNLERLRAIACSCIAENG